MAEPLPTADTGVTPTAQDHYHAKTNTRVNEHDTRLAGVETLGSTNPAAIGTVAVGVSVSASHEDHVHPSTGLVLATEKGAANGVATLGADSLIPAAQLPLLTITDTFPVASEAAQLALTAQVGDVAIRTDLSRSYILRVAPATAIANWSELLSPSGAVSSVDGLTGVVSLPVDGAATVGTKRTLGRGALQAVAGNDVALTDARDQFNSVLRNTDLTQANSVAELAMWNRALGAQTSAGRRFRFDFVAELLNNSGVAVTYTLRLRLTSLTGAVVFVTGALSVPTNADVRPFVGSVDVRMVSTTVLRASALGIVGVPAGLGAMTFGTPLASLVAHTGAAGAAVTWSAGVTVLGTMQMGTANAAASWTLRDLELTTYT